MHGGTIESTHSVVTLSATPTTCTANPHCEMNHASAGSTDPTGPWATKLYHCPSPPAQHTHKTGCVSSLIQTVPITSLVPAYASAGLLHKANKIWHERHTTLTLHTRTTSNHFSVFLIPTRVIHPRASIPFHPLQLLSSSASISMS